MKKFIIIVAIVAALSACGEEGQEVRFDDKAGVNVAARLHSLKVGEYFRQSDIITYIRVPGGWVYKSWSGYGVCAVFIPYSEEGK